MTGLLVGKYADSRRSFELPLEFVVEASAILAMRGAGKTYLAKVVVEATLEAGEQVIVLDPKGDWWGLRSDYPVVIFGGQHADVPLTTGSGEMVADVLVDSGFSAIIDLSDFSKAAARNFVAELADRLYWAKRLADKQEAVLVVVDEADAFVPQRIAPGGEKCYGAIDVMVRRGRGRGLGCMLITQRPAVLAKDVLSQVSVLVTMRMGGRHDIQATDAWITAHGDVEHAAALKASLPSLPTGTAWFWAPYLLGELSRVEVRKAKSFDSSATPRPGMRRAKPKALQPVDIEALGAKIAASVEAAKAEDPRELRKRIRELEEQLATIGIKVETRVETKVVEVPVLSESLVDALDATLDSLKDTVSALRRVAEPVTAALAAHRGSPPARVETRGGDGGAAPPAPRPKVTWAGPDGPELGKTERNVLTVLVQHGSLTHAQIALLAGYSVKASTIGVALSRLRKAGYVDSNGQPVSATPEGVARLGDAVEPLPTGEALLNYWLNRFGLTERRVLSALLDLWPQAANLEMIAIETGYSSTASTIGVALSKLRKVGVVSGWRLSEDFARAIGR